LIVANPHQICFSQSCMLRLKAFEDAGVEDKIPYI
jgi:7-cyano-7-deazaguanine synthase in queuosine biosynthesis